MFKKLKRFTKGLITNFVRLFGKTKLGGYVFEQIIATKMQTIQQVRHDQTELIFTVPNIVNRFRVDTFSTKEPETLEWIDSIPIGAIFWDIGANVGLYSCYAAKSRHCRVFSFEPSVFNLELLARNVFLNGLVENVTIVPLPLSDSMAISVMRLTSTEWGGALSTFGKEFGWDGKRIQPVFKFQTTGLSMEDVVEHLQYPIPEYVKMDVDGLEHFILKGGGRILKKISGLLIEINDDFLEQANLCKSLLENAGMTLLEKRHAEMFDAPNAFGGGKVFNQIWVRQ